jgi:hypothetical protein
MRLLISFFLVALCVMIHASGITWSLRRLDRSKKLADTRYWVQTWCLVQVAGWLIFLHLLEMSLWALVFMYGQAMPDLQSALYFSSVTYTTVGYGDLVLSDKWRLVGGIEALTGILMCGWSTGFFFNVLSRTHQSRENLIIGN